MTIRRLFLFTFIIVVLLTCSLAFAQAQDIPCDKMEYPFAQGQVWYAHGNFTGAISAYSCALQTRPDNAAIFNERGNAYRRLGNYALALADYNQAIELDATNANFFNNRGYVEYQQKALGAALTDFNRAITLDPNLAYAYNNRGLVYAQQGQTDLAAADFSKAIELKLDPISWPTTNLANLGLSPAVVSVPTAQPVVAMDDLTQGIMAVRAEDYDTAIAAFTRAIDAAPNSFVAYCERASVYYLIGDYKNAITDFSSAIELAHNPLHYVWRGNSYAHLGEPDKAFADYKSAIDHDPNYMNAYLYSAALHVEQKDDAAAHSDFKRWLDGMQNRIMTVDAPAKGESLKLDFMTGQEVYAIIFKADAGNHINAETSVPVGTGIDPVLILSTDGVPVVVDDDSGPGLNPQIKDFNSSTEGTYTLYVMVQGTVGSAELKLGITQ